MFFIKENTYTFGVLPPEKDIVFVRKNYKLYKDGTLYVFGQGKIGFQTMQVRAGEIIPEYAFGKDLPVVRRIVIAHGVSAFKTPYELRQGSFDKENIWEIPNTLTSKIEITPPEGTVYYEKGFDLSYISDYSFIKNMLTWIEVKT